MFTAFFAHFAVDATAGRRPSAPRRAWAGELVIGWDELMSEYAGASFERGLYRLHDADSGRWADGLLATRFPSDAAHTYAFGWDWAGRQFVFDRRRRTAVGEPMVQLSDLLTGQRFEIDSSFRDFHNHDLIERQNSALDSELFAAFAAACPEQLPLRSDQVVGYKIPLSLGGAHEVDNMVVIDADVEIGLGLQIGEQTDVAEDGARVEGARIGE